MISPVNESVSHVCAPAAFVEWTKQELEQTLAQRFERQVEKHATSVAVRSASGPVTYDQLNRAANRIAHALLEWDAQLGARVALLLSHDAPQMAAVLGALKAGKVCVVLAPSHPDTRLKEILEDSGAGTIVADAQHLERANSLASDARRVIKADLSAAHFSDQNPRPIVSPDALAFIIYTSGTMGKPRGVMQTHRNILHNIRRHTHGLRLCSTDRIALLSSCNAAQGMATMFCALLNGATLCPRDLSQESVAGLAGWLVEKEVTVYVSAATVFRHFVRTLNGETFPNIRLVRLASEPVHRRDLDLFQACFSEHCVFANTYSSTEAGNMCQFRWNQKISLPDETMPIGFPVEDMALELVDDNGAEVPVGAIGEIVVRSKYLSPGYWNNPEQTRAVFDCVPGSDERIYRTRDLGRRHVDGWLEHMGRKDNQIKVRGFRVYPDEIRHRLCRHPAILDAVVEGQTDVAGQARLIAYFIAHGQQAPTARELRQHLKEHLPEFMVPSSYVRLEAFPRTPNGKLDRTTLRKLEIENPADPRATAKPRTEQEELLAGILKEILGCDVVGIDDSFFELGGDSLMIAQLALRIEQVLHVIMPLGILFQNRTVAELSAAIEHQRKQSSDEAIRPISRATRECPLPLSYSQERSWLYSRSDNGAMANLLCNGYILDGQLHAEALQRSLNELVRRHESFRTTFHATESGAVQMVHPPLPVLLRWIDLKENPRAEEEADAIWCQEARGPIDLEHGPMLRATLLRIHDTRHWLLVTYHHIISDAWSRDIFLREFGIIYTAYASGRPSPLLENSLHYADFAVWQRQLLRPDGKLYQTQLAYWKQQLHNPPPRLDLPFTNSRRKRTSTHAEGKLPWKIPAEVSQQLQTIGRQEGATLFMTRLAAFAAQLHRLTGAEDVIIASYMTNRNRPEVQDIIGFFSNLVMLRLDLRGNPSYRDLLRRVRATTLNAADHSDIPFEELGAELKRQNLPVPKPQLIFEVKYGEAFMQFGDLKVRRMERKSETMPWGFQLWVKNAGDQSEGVVLFDSNLYAAAAVSETLSDLQRLLCECAANPDRRLAQLGSPSRRRRWIWF